jgi:hypothetical protein
MFRAPQSLGDTQAFTLARNLGPDHSRLEQCLKRAAIVKDAIYAVLTGLLGRNGSHGAP